MWANESASQGELRLEMPKMSLDQLIEVRAIEYTLEVHLAVRRAAEFINRSCGQRLRYVRERFSQLTVEK